MRLASLVHLELQLRVPLGQLLDEPVDLRGVLSGEQREDVAWLC